MAVQIICVNKDNGNHYNPYEAIERFGWYQPNTGEKGVASMADMIDFLEKGNEAYVLDPKDSTDKAYLIVQERGGRKYIQTIADGELTDNLLELSECRV